VPVACVAYMVVLPSLILLRPLPLLPLAGQTCLRIWDAFFAEGDKILFRIALALLKLNEGLLSLPFRPASLLAP